MQTDRKSYAKQLVTERTGREVEEHLRELYVERRYTDEEIGVVLGIARATVQMWRREYGISRADRKAALA